MMYVKSEERERPSYITSVRVATHYQVVYSTISVYLLKLPIKNILLFKFIIIFLNYKKM